MKILDPPLARAKEKWLRLFGSHHLQIQKGQTCWFPLNSVKVSPPPTSRIMTPCRLTEWQIAFISLHHIHIILGQKASTNHYGDSKRYKFWMDSIWENTELGSSQSVFCRAPTLFIKSANLCETAIQFACLRGNPNFIEIPYWWLGCPKNRILQNSKLSITDL